MVFPSENNTPLVSIIIVSWNGLPLLQQCLPSVMATSYTRFEVIIADNASTDDTVSWLQENYPAVRIITHPENWAFCKGNNEAIPHANGAYILLLNNDVEVDPGWLAPLVATLDADPSIAAVQPKLLQYADRSFFEYAGASGGFIDRYGYPFTRGRLFFTMEQDEGQYNDARDVFWATGAALLLRRAALDQVGYLDEAFFMHMEEIDLCWRLHRHGYRVRVEPASVVYHIGGASLPQGNPRKTYYNFRNSLLMLYKNLTPAEWRKTFYRRIIFDALAMIRALATGAFGEFGAIFRAYKDAHVMSKSYADKRPATGSLNTQLIYERSIVLDYFIKGHKHFKDLPEECFNRP